MSDRATDAVVVAVARTPFGRFEGGLKNIVAPRLGALAINEALSRASLAPDQVDAVYSGVGMMASALLTPVRQAVLFSNLPETTPSASIDRACCSGMTAIGLAMKDIRCGEAKALICGGFEFSKQHSDPVAQAAWPAHRRRLRHRSSAYARADC